MDEIKVTVCKYPDRANLVLRYIDPITGKQKTRSAGTPREDEAIKEAGKWEDELRSGRYQPTSRLTWAEFRRRLADEKLSAMPVSSQVAYRVALDHLQRLIDPDRLAKLTPQVMSRFQAEARKEGMKATTLARHLRCIKACLRWGERQGLIAKAPTIEMPKLPKGQSMAKHRAVTAEEFDRMLAAVPKIRPHDAPAWERLLRGLWLSGLRLSEAVALDWTDGPLVLNTTGKYPAFHIEAEGQKSRRAEIVPAAPDFAEWVLGVTPEAERVGRVFPLVDPKTGKPLRARNTVGPVVSAIGRKAGVVVGQSEKQVTVGGKRVKQTVKLFAGAHDLRRAFCSRWARKVMPAVLQRLARHAHISTTMSYYVCLSADEIGSELWEKHTGLQQGNILGNIEPEWGNNGERQAVAKSLWDNK
jgi:integrase